MTRENDPRDSLDEDLELIEDVSGPDPAFRDRAKRQARQSYQEGFQKHQKRRTTRRTYATLVATALIPLCVLFSYHFSKIRSTVVAQEEEKAEMMASELARTLTLDFQRTMKGLDTVLKAKAFHQRPVPNQAEKEQIAQLVESYDLCEDITLFSETGQNLFSTTGFFPEIREKTAWFERAKAGAQWISTPHLIRDREGLQINIYLPLASFQRVARARVASPIFELLSGVEFGAQGLALLVDQKGKMFYHPDDNEVLSYLPKPGRSSFLTGEKAGVIELGDGNDYLFVRRKVDLKGRGEDCYVLGLQPMSHINKVVASKQLFQAMVGCALFAGSLAICFLMLRLLTHQKVVEIMVAPSGLQA